MNRGQDSIAMLPECLAELDQRSNAASRCPRETSLEVFGGSVLGALVELPQFLFEEVGAVEALVQASDIGEPKAIFGTQRLRSLEQGPARPLDGLAFDCALSRA